MTALSRPRHVAAPKRRRAAVLHIHPPSAALLECAGMTALSPIRYPFGMRRHDGAFPAATRRGPKAASCRCTPHPSPIRCPFGVRGHDRAFPAATRRGPTAASCRRTPNRTLPSCVPPPRRHANQKYRRGYAPLAWMSSGSRPRRRSRPSRMVMGCGGHPGMYRSTGTIASAPLRTSSWPA